MALAGCRLAVPPAPLPADWAVLVVPVSPYRALYRLSCCGRRDLVAAVRGSAETVHLSVAAPPAGSLLEVWAAGTDAAVLDSERRCRAVVATGSLPVTPELSLPLAPRTLAALVSGRLPTAAAPLDERPGWLGAEVDGMSLLLRVTGRPPRLTGLELAAGEDGPVLAATMTGHRGLVPGVLDVAVGERTLHLELQYWEQGVEPVPPVWLSMPVCGGER
ncbi:MAG TPA: hypothetical protein P5234_14940 [Thermoanaerobaculaceae bacterium]|nr:hypothetical protein [Thermoanaerobaculaceae bacterium]HRS17530.1 hypothetical protein [Thermoanaerobaculaceae bacterium]